MFKRRINVSQGERKNRGEGETMRREEAADSACVSERAREEEESLREITESLK